MRHCSRSDGGVSVVVAIDVVVDVEVAVVVVVAVGGAVVTGTSHMAPINPVAQSQTKPMAIISDSLPLPPPLVPGSLSSHTLLQTPPLRQGSGKHPAADTSATEDAKYTNARLRAGISLGTSSLAMGDHCYVALY